jgi:hypothetical protein
MCVRPRRERLGDIASPARAGSKRVPLRRSVPWPACRASALSARDSRVVRKWPHY